MHGKRCRSHEPKCVCVCMCTYVMYLYVMYLYVCVRMCMNVWCGCVCCNIELYKNSKAERKSTAKDGKHPGVCGFYNIENVKEQHKGRLNENQLKRKEYILN